LETTLAARADGFFSIIRINSDWCQLACLEVLWAKKMTNGEIAMLSTTKIALAAALIFGTAAAALASDSGEDKGGFVVPGSTAGVNPVYHPDIFGAAGKTDKAGKAYNYVMPAQPKKPAPTK
jgi:hypothetical protein